LARTGPASIIPYPCHQTNNNWHKDFTLNVKLQEQVNYLCTTEKKHLERLSQKTVATLAKILKIERMIFQHH
jgi:hypothetical protein